MAPKAVKRLKRSLPPKKQDGIDPRLVALGAIGGGVAGARSGYKSGTREVARSIFAESYSPDENTYWKKGKGGWEPDMVKDRFGTAAIEAGWNSRGKLGKRGSKALTDTMLTGAQDKKYGRKATVSRGRARVIAGAAMAAEGKRRAKPRAIKGAIGGAALAALVQLVAKELNKK